MYKTSPNNRIPLAPILTRSRKDIAEQLTRPIPTGQGIARQTATTLRNWHARHYLKATQRLMDTLDAAAISAVTGTSSGLL